MLAIRSGIAPSAWLDEDELYLELAFQLLEEEQQDNNE